MEASARCDQGDARDACGDGVMTPTVLVDNIMASVRAILRREPRFHEHEPL
jgi:hypothetical protein